MKTILRNIMLIYKSPQTFIAIFVCCLLNCTLLAKGGIITTIAGGDTTTGFGGDNGPAQNAKFYWPEGLCLDKWGNIYIADAGNNRVRRIDNVTGIITSIAGDGNMAYGGDSGPAVLSKLNIPCAVFPDSFGNIYIADANNNRIRKVTIATGVITTVAGNGNAGNSGDGMLAINAELNVPVGLCLDKAGNIYIADYSNNKIRKVNVGTGIITTVAGSDSGGYAGDGGLATKARLAGCSQVFVDNAGDIFITDQMNARVRKVNALTGVITTIAGNGIQGYTGDNGPAANAELGQPTGIFISKENDIYINDYVFGVIRKIDGSTGIITTIAGTGVTGYSGDGGLAINAQLRSDDVFLDQNENIFIADIDNNAIRKITSTVGVNNVIAFNNDFHIYPNPARSEIVIANSNYSGNITTELYDLSGKRVMQGVININHGGTKLPLKLTPGSYFLHFRTENLDEHVERVTVY